MIFKTLQHKKLPGIFGHIIQVNNLLEIAECSSPHLFGNKTTKKALNKMYESHPIVLKQLKEYKLTKVTIIIH